LSYHAQRQTECMHIQRQTTKSQLNSKLTDDFHQLQRHSDISTEASHCEQSDIYSNSTHHIISSSTTNCYNQLNLLIICTLIFLTYLTDASWETVYLSLMMQMLLLSIVDLNIATKFSKKKGKGQDSSLTFHGQVTSSVM